MSKRRSPVKTTEDFIRRAREKHGDRYDYSCSHYTSGREKIAIRCPEHGEFRQLPGLHMMGQGCPLCNRSHKMTRDEFIAKARAVHGDTYGYEFVDYRNNRTKVEIVCPEHGPFMQSPDRHLSGGGCQVCGGTKHVSEDGFIARATAVHNGRYTYDMTGYRNNKSIIGVICPDHGRFSQMAKSHLDGHGCPACGGSLPLTTETFIARARMVHGDRYDYSKSVYRAIKEKLVITCPEHGDFTQDAYSHIHGVGCPGCFGTPKLTTEEFIRNARRVHGDRYDYSMVRYDGNKRNVTIVCPVHGPFSQLPLSHVRGSGCPRCLNSKMEDAVSMALKERGIPFTEQQRFDWLVDKSAMRLDFYLPGQGVAIECQGHQHFMPVSIFGGEEGYENTLRRDALKRELCEQHGIRVFYYSTVLEGGYPYKVYDDIENLIYDISNQDMDG